MLSSLCVPSCEGPPFERICESHMRSGGWLHNMSAPPKSVVQYGGLPELLRSQPGAATGGQREGMPKAVALRFELVSEFTTCSPGQLLSSLGITPMRAAQSQLDALIDARAAELPLPAGCAVIACQSSHRVIWQDLLTVLAVLSKCSDTLWLRDKSPSLSSALTKRRASLLVPPRFVPLLPKESS